MTQASVSHTSQDWVKWGSPAVGDALRRHEQPFQCMDAGIHAVGRGMKMAGPAYTVRTYPGATWAIEQAIERAQPGEVLVVDAGGRPDVIILGELMSTRAQHRGIAGMIVDGAVRDIDEIAALGFPVFARYVSPRAGTHDRVGQWQCPIACGRVVVNPGDMVVADASGVAVVPAAIVAVVGETAAAICRKEAAMARCLKAGDDLPTAAARAAEAESQAV